MDEYLKQANKFLKKHNTKLDVKFKRFDTTSWSKDGQKVNLFAVTLSNVNGSYDFTYGSSIVDSCEQENEIDTVDKIEVFAGLHYTESKINVSVKFEVLKKNGFGLDYEEVEKYANEMLESYNRQKDATVKKYYDAFKEGRISRNQRDAKIKRYSSVSTTNNGAYVQCISKAIKREVEAARNNKQYSKTKQKDGIEYPNAYDILAGLYVSYFESPDEVVEEFGCMKPSQALAIYEQDQALQKLFTENQLEDLSEIA